jgi:hypothetical protein
MQGTIKGSLTMEDTKNAQAHSEDQARDQNAGSS